VAEILGREGYEVETAGDGAGLRAALARRRPDLLILDLMLPGEDGVSLCRATRADSPIPIIILTAKGDEADRVDGLESGADDYLSKPFGGRELLARIRAVLRRAAPGEAVAGRPVLAFAGWCLDTGRRTLTSPEGVLVDLSSGEYDLLLAFLRHPHRTLSRDELLDLARGRVAGPFDRTIDVQVGHLRRKLEADPKSPELIKTIRGEGYVLAADVRNGRG
jgi:two-component system OmpR family response regulator